MYRTLEANLNRVGSEVFNSDRNSRLRGKVTCGVCASRLMGNFQCLKNSTTPIHKILDSASLFSGENLKKGASSVSYHSRARSLLTLSQKADHEVDVALDRTIIVFRYLTDEDAFRLCHTYEE